MNSKQILVAMMSVAFLMSVPAWADHDGDEHGHGHAYAHGEKRGWHGCDLPPGQAKKHGCYAAPVRVVHRPVVVVAPPPPPRRVVVVEAAPPPPPRVHIVVAAPVLPPPPPPPAAGLNIHVDAVIHP